MGQSIGQSIVGLEKTRQKTEQKL